MTRPSLLFRSLLHFRAASLASIAGVAVATAVLTGALMVGDSVSGSLRELATQRLGPVDHAVVASRFFPEDLAARLQEMPEFHRQFELCIPGIAMRGGAADARGKARTAGVQITAVADWIRPDAGSCIINAQLADSLGITAPGSAVSLNLPSADDTPRDAALARRGRADLASGLRCTVANIARDRGMASLFTLSGGQRTPSNAWVNLRDLQNAIGQSGRANLLLVKAKADARDARAAESLNALLRSAAQLADYDLTLAPSADKSETVISSRSTYISPAIERAGGEVAAALKTPLRRSLVYLINNVIKAAPEQGQSSVIHYAIVAGIDPMEGGSLADDEIALNSWAAERLKARAGDRIRLDYYQRQPNGDLKQVSSDQPGIGLTFRIARILPMIGIGADPTLTPLYKGLTDTDAIAKWQAPEGLEINKRLVTREDEEYWAKHRAAPKLFVSLGTAQRLWGGAYGSINTLRVPAGRSEDFARELLRRLQPTDAGLGFVPIKAQQLAAAGGSSEFSGLFLGFSCFIIAAAALLLAMLLRLSIEQRARQFGLLASLGFTPRTLLGMALAEGLVIAVAGGLIGMAAALGYTWLMIAGLRTWWIGAVGTTALRLHAPTSTLMLGLAVSIAVAMLAVIWAVWRVGRTAPATLLAGGWGRTDSAVPVSSRRALVIALVPLTAGLLTLVLGLAGRIKLQVAFISGGAMLLAAFLGLVAARLRPLRRDVSHLVMSLGRLGIRNASRHRARSILTIGLVAFASFLLVTVASMKQRPPGDTHRVDSGTGGYQLILQADLPLLGDIGTAPGRKILGVREPDLPIWKGAQFMPMRVWAGQDISCLNITRPTSPTILAVPPALTARAAFKFARTIERTDHPWRLLDRKLHDAIPVIADDETASYILKLAPGERLRIIDEAGQSRQLELVATLEHSIFQSELLMAESDFLRLFPSQSGFGTVLVQADDKDLPALQRLLSDELSDFSVSVEPTGQRLARYQDVANTYLATFQTLGSLGLMLGTIGLAVVLLRSLVERRAEIALLSALGFTPAARQRLILAENAFLLILGLIVGAVCALISILPAVLASARAINLAQLGVTLSAVAFIGLGALFIAMKLGMRRSSPAALRAE